MSYSEFNIYQADASLRPQGEAVEVGLSAGEMRQALLDRFLQDLREEPPHEGFYGGQADLASRVEERLYTMEDEDLVGRAWRSKHEVVYVEGVEA